MKLKSNKLVIVFVIVIILVALGAFFLKNKGFTVFETKGKTYLEVNVEDHGQCITESDLNSFGDKTVYKGNKRAIVVGEQNINSSSNGIYYLIETHPDCYQSTCALSSNENCNNDAGWSFIEGWPDSNIKGLSEDGSFSLSALKNNVENYAKNHYLGDPEFYDDFVNTFNEFLKNLEEANYNTSGVSPIENASRTCSVDWAKPEDGAGFTGPAFLINGQGKSLTEFINSCGKNYCDTVSKYIMYYGGKYSFDLLSEYKQNCGNLTYSNVCEGPTTLKFANTTLTNVFYRFGMLTTTDCRNQTCDKNKYEQALNGNHCIVENNALWFDGCQTDVASFIKNCKNEYGVDTCNSTVQDKLKTELTGNSSLIDQVNAYNNNCDNDIEYGSITVYQGDLNTTYGLSCDQNGWETSETGACKHNLTVGSTVGGPIVNNLMEHETNKFSYWSRNSDCSSRDITNNTFTLSSSGNEVYYACYEQGVGPSGSTSDLFNYDGSKNTNIDDKTVKEKTSCSSSSNSQLTDVSTYYRRTTKPNNNTVISNVSGNNYCNVVCVDEAIVKYPNVFPTVPAGQYFELMYEPEITASRSCTAEFNYTKWKQDYDKAIEAEIKAMDELNFMKAKVDAWNNSGTENECKTNPDGTSSCRQVVYAPARTYSYGSLTQVGKPYKQAGYVSGTNYIISSSSKDYKYFQRGTYDGDGPDVSSEKPADDALTKAENTYKEAVNKRLNLEKNNMQCYSALDQDKSTGQYKDVFANNYTDPEGQLKLNDVEYKVLAGEKTSYGTKNSQNNNYATFIKDNSSITDTDLQATGTLSGISTSNFYPLSPSIKFKYDDGSTGAPLNSNGTNQEETLSRESHVKLDTGSYTDSNNYTKVSASENISKTFTGDDSYQISFTSYFNNEHRTTHRTVKYYFLFHEATEWLSQYQTGLTKKKDSATTGYVTLSREETYTMKNSTQKVELLNNVYPVSLKAVAGKYNTIFQLEATDSYFNLFGTSNRTYSCPYNISNDALILAGDKQTYKDLKSNTIFRPIATNDIDPNDRALTGNLGENWTNDKGKAAIESINNEYGNGTKINDTYNPKNLEYSFTLTPKLIQLIKDYNDDTSYDDFNLKCATDDGRECTSAFLTNLAQGKVNGSSQSNYSRINSWGLTELKNTRKNWKYYEYNSSSNKGTITIGTKQATIDSNGNINNPRMPLEEYLQKYREWGVLP